MFFARLRSMIKKTTFSILGTLVFLHLMNLFVLHFGERFHPSDFDHGFKKSYQTRVSGLDYSKLDSIFSQPFHYLGHGKQMNAFESADGTVVLKLFNPMRPLKKGWYKRWKYWQRYSSIKWISREWFHKKERLEKLFTRHKIAFEKLKDETGLVFVHLTPSKRVNHLVTVIDNKGKTHILELGNTPFVLQEKAKLVPVYLNELVGKNALDEAKRAISSLKNLFERRIALGITDRIQTMENNYGFVGNKPIQIDVGRIRIDESLFENPNEERSRILNNFQSWYETKYPALQEN